MTALKATQEKKDLLEQSLSAETKVKMDLFSALGEAKRDISMKDGEYVNDRSACFFICRA